MHPAPLRLLAALPGGGDWVGALGSEGTMGNLRAVTWVTGGDGLGVGGAEQSSGPRGSLLLWGGPKGGLTETELYPQLGSSCPHPPSCQKAEFKKAHSSSFINSLWTLP